MKRFLIALTVIISGTGFLKGCDKDAALLNDLAGTWEYEEDITSDIEGFIDLGDDIGITFAPEDIDFKIKGFVTVDTAGKYTCEYSTDSIREWIDKAKKEESVLFDEYVGSVEQDIASEQGISYEEFKERYEAVDYEEVFDAVYGKSLTDLVGERFDELEESLVFAVSSMKDSGTVKVINDKLYLYSDYKSGCYEAEFDDSNDTLIMNPGTEDEIVLLRSVN